MEAPRVRLEFEDPTILSCSQRRNGLNRSWILVEPTLRTISDVVSHLLHTFHLSASCPNGVLLSMDGFVLPRFESTAILKDKDLVCVKRVRSKLKLIRVMTECGVKKDVMEPKIVANEEDEDKLQNGDVSIKKRKASKPLNNSKLSGLNKNQETETPSCLPDGTEKVSVARSTSRKKAKRRWLRAQRLAEKEQKHLQQVEDLSADVAF